MSTKIESHDQGGVVASSNIAHWGCTQENFDTFLLPSQAFFHEFQNVEMKKWLDASYPLLQPAAHFWVAPESAYAPGKHAEPADGGLLDRLVSTYDGISPVPTNKKTVREVLADIKAEILHDKVIWVREAKGDNDEYRKRKKTLPSVSFGGLFSRRANDKITHPTGFITADLDHLRHVADVFNLLTQDPFVAFAFRSPGDDGIKGGFYAGGIATDADHKLLFAAVERYFREVYGIAIDPACKDISRLTFLSSDPNLHVNPAALPFPIEEWLPSAPQPDDQTEHQTEPPTSSPDPQPTQPNPESHQGLSGKALYAWEVLQSACDRIRRSQPTQQHPTRLREARLIGGYLHHGLDETEVLAELEAAVRDSGAKDMAAAMKTIRDGLEYGKHAPIEINDTATKVPTAACDSKQTAVQSVPSDAELKELARRVLDAKVPCGTFDTQHLPPMIMKYIDEICSTTDSEPITVVSSVYGMLSGMIGKRMCIGNDQYFQKLYPNLWMLTASKSGMFKTTAQNKGAKIAKDFEAAISEEVRHLKDELEQLSLEKQDDKSKKKIFELKKEILEKEAASPVLPNRSTAHGLIDLLSEGYGGTIFLSEFGDWLKTMEHTYNAGLKSLLTDFYDVPKRWKDRTRTGGTTTVERPFISISAVSTLTWIMENVKPEDVGSGFFARFLLFYPPQDDTKIPPALPSTRQLTDNSTEKDIVAILRDIKPDTFMTLSQNARRVFESVHQALYRDIQKRSEKNREILMPYLKRWSPYVLKIAMLNQPFLDPGSTEITVEALKGGISIVENAIKSTTYLFENELGESENQRKCRVVLEFIAKRGGRAKRHDILSSRVLSGGAKDYDYVLETLEESGRVALEKAGLKKDWIYTIISVG
jgi:hypothetical protein